MVISKKVWYVSSTAQIIFRLPLVLLTPSTTLPQVSDDNQEILFYQCVYKYINNTRIHADI